MKTYIILLFIILYSQCFSQRTISVIMKDSCKYFSISMLDTTYKSTDTIKIYFHAENTSEKNFYVSTVDIERLSPVLDTVRKTVYSDYGGIFDPEFQRVKRLQLWSPGQTIDEPIVIPAGLFKIVDFPCNAFFFYVWLGYFDYDSKLKYLTKGTEETVGVPNIADIDLLINLHHDYRLGYLPIVICR
jgi:hypothetical protein